jgi:glycosyltransferase involved in cell wall biosynthesis
MTDNFRIALIGPLPPPSGGMANQTLQLSQLLRQEGLRVELVQVNAPYRPGWVGAIKGLRALFRLLPYLWCVWRAAGRAELLHVMANSGWSWHLFAAPAIWIGRLRGKAVVVNYRGGEAVAFLDRSLRTIKPTLRRADILIVPSAFLEQIFVRYGFASHIVPNIIDLDRFAPDVTETIAAQRRPPHIVVARNLEPLYDNATALRAFALVRQRFPDVRMTIAGAGPEREFLLRLTHELGVAAAVTFSGRLDNARMAALYRSAHIALNPSMADNMPISILEALASGVPVVSTAVGGVPFLVTHETTALLVPAQDPQAMAQALLRVLDDPALAQRLTAAGLILAQQFSWPRVRDVLFAAYRAALDTAAPARRVLS